MKIEAHKSLQEYNTFGIDVKARHFVSVKSIAELKNVISLEKYPNHFILGGGSNILFTKDIDALVIHLNLKGISIEKETEDHLYIKAMAGENWHEFVLYCIKNNYGGIENLSLIPGNLGTTPIQNIGAYGVELKDVFYECEAFDLKTKTQKCFSKTDCEFGYRNSIFKNSAKDKYIITSVTLKLTKKNHRLNYSYGAITDQLKKENTDLNIKAISKAVINIRQSKIPNPKEIGNSGSFFKNPIINSRAFSQFQKQYPQAPFYKLSEEHYKVPAGWLIEQTGFKGKRFGDAGVHKNQALVLVNYGSATGLEILNLAKNIQEQVSKKFNITLEPEVNVL